METNTVTRLTIPKKDHEILVHYLQTTTMDLHYDRMQADKLLQEIRSAHVVPNTEFSRDMIRLNSKVTVRNTIARQNHEYTLVLPREVDHKNNRLSILSPLGAAMLGFRKGDTIKLPAARGYRLYTVLSVTNPVD